MQNEFEKEVQRKMDELRFQPSVPVWEGVEAAIRQKRKRRRILILIPFLLFLGLGSAMLINNNVFQAETMGERIEKERERERERERTGTRTRTRTGTGTGTGTGTAIENKEINVEKEVVKGTNKENTGPLNSENKTGLVIANGPGSDKVKRNETGSVSKGLKGNTRKASRASKKNENPEPKKNDEFSDDVARIEVVKEESSGKETKISVTGDKNEKEKQKEKEGKIEEGKKEEVMKKVDSINNKIDTVKLPAVAKTSKSLKWGVVVNGGISSESAGLQLGQEKVAYADVTQSGPITGGFGNNGGQIPSNASPIRHALSFSVGISAEKELSRNVFINAALMYSYFSNYRQVGNYITDSLGGGSIRPEAYYSNSGSRINTASNRFHFISLPINLKFTAFEKLSIEAGGGISYLVSSKAYTFNSLANGYYATDDVNKLQAFANLGVSYTVLKKGTKELRLGPSLQYNLSNWTKYETGRHLYSASVSAKYFFN